MLKALHYPGNVPFDSLFIPAIYHEIYYDGIYMDIVNVLDKERTDPVVVDVGANIGIVTQYLREHAKKVYAIEPSTEHFEALEKNKEFNKWDNVELFKFAISDTDGETNLRLFGKNRTSHSIYFSPQNPDDSLEKVSTKKLTTFFKENKIDHVDFMKFDVEGAEELILPTPDFEEASKIIDVIMIEFHQANYPEHINRLIKLGYQARRYPCSAVVVAFNK
jgi:FkbM family methyltransferase